MASLIGKILINKALPNKREILGSVGKLIKETVKNPKKAIKEGIARDKAANAIYKGLTGKGRLQAAKEVVIKASKGAYKGGGKDLVINTVGAGASALGGSTAGVVGKLGGDYIGARVARRALDDAESVVSAIKQVSKEKGLKLSWLRDGKVVHRRAVAIAKMKRRLNTPEYHKDAIGWGIGNASAEGLQKAGSHIPLQGGIVAMNSVDAAYKGIKVGKRISKRNTPKQTAYKATIVTSRRLKKNLNINRKIRKGVEREKVMYDSINKELQTLPDLPKGINFKRNIKLLSEFTRKSKK